MEAVVLGNGVIRVRATLVKSLSSLITISSGGSIGREGPMVQLASMLGSLLGRHGEVFPGAAAAARGVRRGGGHRLRLQRAADRARFSSRRSCSAPSRWRASGR